MASAKETRAGLAPINGTDLYFEMKGAGQALLFIHAGVADSRMWDDQFEVFAETHRGIRCDLRGFGRSIRPAGLFAHYEDIAALLKYLQVEQVTVIGASFGGYVALNFGLAYPDMVTALALAAPALGGYEFTSAEVLEFFEAEEKALAQGDLAAATELNLKMWVDGFNRSAGEVSTQVRERVKEMQLNIFSQPEVEGTAEKELVPPAIERLDQIEAPTLVMVGDKDAAEFQAISRLLAENIRHASHVVIPGAAHLPSMEKPDEFNRLVLDFLK